MLSLLLLLAGAPALASGNLLPAAHAGPDQSGTVGTVLGFSGNASQDPDGSIVSYDWNFGDGATATGAYVSHAFADTGTFTVALTVTDNSGGTGTDTATVYVCASLRSALDAAPPGSVLQLEPCTYIETLVVNKTITIRGGPGVVFDGRTGQAFPRNGPVFTIAASDVSIKDVTMTNWNGNAVQSYGQWKVRLTNLTLVNTGALNVRLSESVVIEASRLGAIDAYRTGDITIAGTSFSTASLTEANGIRVTESSGSQLDANAASGRIERSHLGFVAGGGNLTLDDNVLGGFSLNGGATLRSNIIDPSLGCCTRSFTGPGTLQGNVFAGYNEVYISGTGAIVRFNEFTGNSLRLSPSSSETFVYLNNFYGVSVQDDGFQNRFDTGSIGNYWSNHTAPDINNDSIRDSPVNVSGSAGSQDRFPLVNRFGGFPTSERAPDVTNASDALVDAQRGTLIPTGGLVHNVTYDLTVTNITPSGAGFGYAYGYGNPGNALALLRPDGSQAGTAPMYADGLRSGKNNVTFPALPLDTAGRWSLVSDGFPIANFTVGINWLVPTSAPNPSGANVTTRALDLQEGRISFPAEARVELGTQYDFTVTNGTLQPGTGLYQLYAPNGTPLAGVEAYFEGLHPGRTNGTFPAVAFPIAGLWTVRGPANTIYTAFEVNAPPGVPPFVANLLLTMANRTDGAAFGVGLNATSGFDAGIDTVEPPAPADPQYVRLYFAGPNGTELHRSIVGRASAISWDLLLQESGMAGTANLTWDPAAFNTIPTNFDVELLDGPTTVDMRLTSARAIALAGTHTLELRIRQTAGLRLDANALFVSPIVTVGAALQANGTIINDGPDVAFDVRATLELDNGTTMTVNAEPSTLVAGATARFTFPGITQTTPGEHVATIRANSSSADNNLANNVATRSYFVASRTVELSFVGSNASLVSPFATATYDVLVTNTGNGNESFALGVSAAPSGWASTLSATQVMLQANESTIVRLNVTAPGDELAEPVARVSVEASAMADPSARSVLVSTSTLSVSKSFLLAEGWSLVSIPVLPADTSIAAVFGPSALATFAWNGTSYASATTVVPGRGYWVYSNATVLRDITGVPQRNVTLLLTPAWNLVGTPLAPSNLSNAPANVSRSAFTWNASGYDELTTLSPFSGYWIYVHNVTASTQLGVGLALQTASLMPAASDDFELAIRFSAPAGERDMIALGARHAATAAFGNEDTMKMPAAPVASSLRATLAPAAGGEGPLHRDIRAPAPHHMWAVDVERRGSDDAIEARWDAGEVAKVPLGYQVELQDGPVRVDMRLVDHYVVLTPAASGHHSLQVIISSTELPGCLATFDQLCVGTASTFAALAGPAGRR